MSQDVTPPHMTTQALDAPVTHAAERHAILDYAGRLGDDDHVGILGVALAQWAARDDSRAEPEVTRAGHAAVAEVDAMLRELNELRAWLVGEIPEHQDIGDARADALLARLRTAKAAAAQ